MLQQQPLEERLLGLSPKLRVAAGAALLLGGIAVSVALWNEGWIWYGAVSAALFGPVRLFGGLGELRRQAAVADELQRVEAEWPALRQAIADWQRRGDNVTRQLQQRGYREYFVRRWILARAAEEGAAVGDVEEEGDVA